MENFANNWKSYIYALWLCGSLYVCFGAELTDPRFWIVTLPVATCVILFNEKECDPQ